MDTCIQLDDRMELFKEVDTAVLKKGFATFIIGATLLITAPFICHSVAEAGSLGYISGNEVRIIDKSVQYIGDKHINVSIHIVMNGDTNSIVTEKAEVN